MQGTATSYIWIINPWTPLDELFYKNQSQEKQLRKLDECEFN